MIQRKPIPDFPGYWAQADGTIWSGRGRTVRQLAPYQRPDGYEVVELRRDGKGTKKYVHRLVLESFCGDCPEGHEARHLNGDKSDNRPTNLAWGTHVENCTDRTRHGSHNRAFEVSEVREIRRRYEEGETQTALASEFGVTQPCIGYLVNRKTYREI